MAKILVIEDEPGVRESIVDILNAEDFIVDSATNGQEGLQILQDFHPDLILCDVMMPVLDGYGVLEQVRQNPATKTLPFIFLTAKAEQVDFRAGMGLGANDYLTKPFTHDDLLQAIHTRLGAQAAIAEQAEQQLDALRSSISLALPRELGTPLEEILSLSDSLANRIESLKPDAIVGMAKAIHRSAEQVSQLTNNLMLAAQLERLHPDDPNAAALRRQHTPDAAAIVQSLAQEMAIDYLRDEDLELSVEPVSVQMSETNFQQVCQELIDNAFKFSEPGQLVKVAVSQHEGALNLYVIDYGHGMTAENIAQIGAFLQFDPDPERQQGAGLGLTIAKRLVELHKGEFLIESILGQQTIVRLVLPCQAEA